MPIFGLTSYILEGIMNKIEHQKQTVGMHREYSSNRIMLFVLSHGGGMEITMIQYPDYNNSLLNLINSIEKEFGVKTTIRH